MREKHWIMYPIGDGVEKQAHLHMTSQSANQHDPIIRNLAISIQTSNAYHLHTAIPLSEIYPINISYKFEITYV